MLAYSYPLLNAFWTILFVFVWVIWIFLLFRVILDIFRSRDIGGGGKALWLIFVIVLPFLGIFVYLIARGRSMTDRDLQQARAQEREFRKYVQETAGGDGASSADELAKLADLRDRGVITEADFQQQKEKLLS